MTEKQKLFCDEYLIDLNGTRAYRTVYKSKTDRTAATRASNLLKKEDIAEYINKRLEEIHNEKTADIQEVMEYLTSVMRGTSEASTLAMCGDGMQEVITKKPDERERLKAAELLGKRYRIFNEKVTLEVEPITIVNDLKE